MQNNGERVLLLNQELHRYTIENDVMGNQLVITTIGPEFLLPIVKDVFDQSMDDWKDRISQRVEVLNGFIFWQYREALDYFDRMYRDGIGYSKYFPSIAKDFHRSEGIYGKLLYMLNGGVGIPTNVEVIITEHYGTNMFVFEDGDLTYWSRDHGHELIVFRIGSWLDHLIGSVSEDDSDFMNFLEEEVIRQEGYFSTNLGDRYVSLNSFRDSRNNNADNDNVNLAPLGS
jgi:hypothetical protein